MKKGFTLIELVIVVSIIAILSGVSLFALGESREAGRDARRKADLEEIASGLELYKADCNVYPNAPLPIPPGSLTGATLPCTIGAGNIYIQAIPDDPDAVNLNYIYAPTTAAGTACAGNCIRFRLWARMEEAPPTLPAYCGPAASAPLCGTGLSCNYCVVNP